MRQISTFTVLFGILPASALASGSKQVNKPEAEYDACTDRDPVHTVTPAVRMCWSIDSAAVAVVQVIGVADQTLIKDSLCDVCDSLDGDYEGIVTLEATRVLRGADQVAPGDRFSLTQSFFGSFSGSCEQAATNPAVGTGWFAMMESGAIVTLISVDQPVTCPGEDCPLAGC